MKKHCYDSSVRSTLLLHESILGCATFELDAHVETVQFARSFVQQHKKDQCATIFDQLIFGRFDSLQQRAILLAKDCNLSSWLSVMPLESHNFDLSPQEFRDALALWYIKPLLDCHLFVMDVVLPLLSSML